MSASQDLPATGAGTMPALIAAAVATVVGASAQFGARIRRKVRN